MKKIFLAGLVTVCMLTMGTTAFAAEAVPRRIRSHGACHRQTDVIWQQNCVRHDCAYVDADGDGVCDNCSWQEARHHCVNEDGYCLNGTCNYEYCGYAYGTGYCRGYCNSVMTDEGVSSSGAVSSEEGLLSGGANAGGNGTDVTEAVQVNQDSAAAENSNVTGAGAGNGVGAGNGSGYNGGYWGHHGNGHRGGHHGCR